MMNTEFRIWFIEYDDDGNEIGRGVYHKSYKYHGTAINVAKKYYGDNKRFKWDVAPSDPFVAHFKESICDICGRTYQEPVSSFNGRGTGGHIWISHERIYGKPIIPSERFDACEECIMKVSEYIKELVKGRASNV